MRFNAQYLCSSCGPCFLSQRLPPDFEPFFAIDTTRRTETETVNGESGDAQGGGRGWRECFTAVGFRVLFAVFSNRMWDRAYLLLLLLWSVQCPAQMDGVVKAKRQQLATLMMVVSVMAVIPAALAVILKAFFPLKLRAHLQSSKGLEVRIINTATVTLCGILIGMSREGFFFKAIAC